MLDFKDITPNEVELLSSYFKKSQYNSSEYCFGNLYIWKSRFHSRYAEKDGFLFIKGCFDDHCYYLMPAGEGDFKKAVELLIEDAKECGHKFIMHCITKDIKEKIDGLFPNVFKFSTSDDTYDYTYSRESLAELTGKKYHSKRNFINRFLSVYGQIDYEDISRDNISSCREMNNRWLSEQTEEDMIPSMQYENDAINRCLNDFFDINMKGGLIRANGEVCAFTIGEHLNDETFVLHIEKASYDIAGAFPVINNEFAKRNLGNYKYINREEDMGIEGLRKAKSSYNPIFRVEKFTAKLRDNG